MGRSVVSSGYSGFLHQMTVSSSSFHRLDMTLAVAEALNPNKPNQTKMGISNSCGLTKKKTSVSSPLMKLMKLCQTNLNNHHMLRE